MIGGCLKHTAQKLSFNELGICIKLAWGHGYLFNDPSKDVELMDKMEQDFLAA